MPRKAIVVAGVVVVALFGVSMLSNKPDNQPGTTKTERISQLQDAHGLAVDRKDSSRVYIATHTGLLLMNLDGKLQRVSENQDDYMGFSAHPTDPSVFYTSGHPHSGGNLGFQKSTDGGKTWQKISDGINGPVDFHAMTVSQANPANIYGVYQGRLQRSNDEGKMWEPVNADIGNIITLTTNRALENTIFAGTTSGLYVSTDRGSTWDKLNISEAVTALAINPDNDQEMYAYSNGRGLLMSSDGGKTWQRLTGYSGNTALHFAIDPQTATTSYLLNQSLEVYKSTDSGKTWAKIR